MNRTLKAIAVLMLMMVFAVGCTKPDEPNNGGNNNGQNDTVVDHNDSIVDPSGTLNGHDFVDLGLPSGTLWATCNVGAITPEEYGDYFAWGETRPKTIYRWNTYKYCNDGDYDQLTKYCTMSSFGYNGFVDSLTVLQPSDDAATANWGRGWCLPTKEQWLEMRDNTNCSEIIQAGVNGILFSANNGNSLFLPATGCYNGDQVVWDDGYWSSSLSTGDPAAAMDFVPDEGRMANDERFVGMPIRPVRTKE